MAAEYIMHHTLPWFEGATDWIVGSAYLTFGLRKLLVHTLPYQEEVREEATCSILHPIAVSIMMR